MSLVEVMVLAVCMMVASSALGFRLERKRHEQTRVYHDPDKENEP